jgi:transcriptional regulator with XRE-family HTH domain
MIDGSASPMSLGEYLESSRLAAGYSVRGLAEMAGIHPSSVNRLLKDQVENPWPYHLVCLASALRVNAADLFALAGTASPTDAPSIDMALRQHYGLSDEQITEAKTAIEAIAARGGQPS